MTGEAIKLEQSRQRKAYRKRWGPYLSERAWGTVREDYLPHGTSALRTRPAGRRWSPN